MRPGVVAHVDGFYLFLFSVHFLSSLLVVLVSVILAWLVRFQSSYAGDTAFAPSKQSAPIPNIEAIECTDIHR